MNKDTCFKTEFPFLLPKPSVSCFPDSSAVSFPNCKKFPVEFLGAFAKLPKTAISFVMSVCLSIRMEWIGSHCKDFHEISQVFFFRKPIQKIQFHYNLTRITRTSHKGQCTFVIMSHLLLLRLGNVSDKAVNQNTYFVFSNFFWKLCRL